jgi:hypothetical protein
VAGPLISLGEINNITGATWKEPTVAGRFLGKRAIVTDPTEYNAADIVALFREKGAEVFAEPWDVTKPEMADEIVREVGMSTSRSRTSPIRIPTRRPTRTPTRISNMLCRGSCNRCIG